MGESYKVQRLSELIKSYFKENLNAELDLRRSIIEGGDLLEVLKDFKNFKLKYEKEASDEHERSMNLIRELEELIGKKTGPFKEKIKNIMDEYTYGF